MKLNKLIIKPVLIVMTLMVLLPVLSEARTYNRRQLAMEPSALNFTGDRSNQWGVGLILGDPSGITAKYWQDYEIAWDFALGSQLASAGISLHADYLLHIRPFSEAPEVPIYIGGGLYMGGSTTTFDLGARGVIGVSYLFEDPFDIFFELTPKFSVAPDLNFYMTLAIGGRLYL